MNRGYGGCHGQSCNETTPTANHQAHVASGAAWGILASSAFSRMPLYCSFGQNKTMWMRLATTSLRFGMRLNHGYSKAHAKGQLLSPSLTLRNLYLKFAALVHSTTLPTIFWNERFRSYPQWMRNGPCSSSIESPRVKVHVDMPNFAIGHYDPSILSAKDDASYRH